MKTRALLLLLLCKFLVAVGLGVAYAYGLLIGAGYFLGAGHGSELPMSLVTTPFQVGPFVWPCVFVLFAFAEFRASRVLGVLLLFANYIALAFQFARSNVSGFAERFHSADFKIVGLLMITAYLVVNIVLWWRFIIEERKSRICGQDGSAKLPGIKQSA